MSENFVKQPILIADKGHQYSNLCSNVRKLLTQWQTYMPYYKRNLRLAFPVMLTQIGAALVGFLDSIMVGHYGTTALAAVSVSNAIFFTVMVLAMGIIMGITPLISIQNGRRDSDENYTLATYRQTVSTILHNGLCITVVLCLVSILILGLCLLRFDLFGQDAAVSHDAKPYFLLIILSIVPFLFFCLTKQFLEGLGNTTVAMIITLFINGLNVFLNWVLIFGHLGFTAMGATGAGWATLISRAIMPLLFLAVIGWRSEWRVFLSMLSFRQLAIKQVKRIVAVGLPIGLQTFLETVLFTSSFVIIGWINKESLAAHHIANQIADMTFMLAIGVGAATTIRVAYQYGCKNIEGLRMAANASIHLVLFFNSIGAMLMIGLCRHIPYLFTTDTTVIDLASGLIFCAGLFQYADGMQAIGISILRGLTDVRRPMIYAFVSYILVALPIGLCLTFPAGMGAMGMWIGFIVGLSFAAVLFHYRFRCVLRRLFASI